MKGSWLCQLLLLSLCAHEGWTGNVGKYPNFVIITVPAVSLSRRQIGLKPSLCFEHMVRGLLPKRFSGFYSFKVIVSRQIFYTCCIGAVLHNALYIIRYRMYWP